MRIHRLLLVVAASATLLAGAATAAATGSSKSLPAPSATDLVHEGMALHDEGRFDEAIARYQRALALEPDHATARYELAFSYGAKKDYTRCVETAREALRHPGEHEAKLYSVAASCLDDAGKAEEAAAMYREGLARHPHDAHLGYNLAVTWWRGGKADAAVAQLLETIADDPVYASPYLLLGTIDHQQHRDLPALFAMLRCLMVDHQSDRSRQTAVLALSLLVEGVTAKPGTGEREGKTDVDIEVSPQGLAEGDVFSTLELSRALAAAAMFAEDNRDKPEAVRKASALETFLTIAAELGARPSSAAATATAEWRLTVAPVLALHEREVGLAFAYLVAERAGLPGAAEWLAANPQAMRLLEAVLSPPAPAP